MTCRWDSSGRPVDTGVEAGPGEEAAALVRPETVGLGLSSRSGSGKMRSDFRYNLRKNGQDLGCTCGVRKRSQQLLRVLVRAEGGSAINSVGETKKL